MTTDGYCHCGLSRYLPVEQVRLAMEHADVERAVLVQHLGEFDNGYLAAVTAAEPGRFAAVALVDHTQPAWPGALAEIASSGYFRGIRITARALSENYEFCLRAGALSLVMILDMPDGFDGNAGVVRRLAGDCLPCPIVVSHLGYPWVDAGHLGRGRDLLTLSDESSVFVLLSGASMFCPFPYSALGGLINDVIAAFGAERVLWGSNFPECGDAAAYRRDLEALARLVQPASSQVIEQITGRTAESLWFGPKNDTGARAGTGRACDQR
jgi:L-fuconolactonase